MKVDVHEFFDSDAGMTRHSRQATATNPNDRCGMINGLSLGTKPRLLDNQCFPHSVNGCHPQYELMMLSGHREISGVASEVCKSVSALGISSSVEEFDELGSTMAKRGSTIVTVGKTAMADITRCCGRLRFSRNSRSLLLERSTTI